MRASAVMVVLGGTSEVGFTGVQSAPVPVT